MRACLCSHWHENSLCSFIAIPPLSLVYRLSATGSMPRGAVSSACRLLCKNAYTSSVFRAGSTAFRTFVPGEIVLVLSNETESDLQTLSSFALIVAPISLEPPSIYQSAIANALFVSDNGVHSRSLVGLSAESSGSAYASTTIDILRLSGSRLPYRAQAHTSPLLATTTARYPSPRP